MTLRGATLKFVYAFVFVLEQFWPPFVTANYLTGGAQSTVLILVLSVARIANFPSQQTFVYNLSPCGHTTHSHYPAWPNHDYFYILPDAASRGHGTIQNL